MLTKEEFEKVAGYEVSNADYYHVILPMYKVLYPISRYDFVKMLSKKHFQIKEKKPNIAKMRVLYMIDEYSNLCNSDYGFAVDVEVLGVDEKFGVPILKVIDGIPHYGRCDRFDYIEGKNVIVKRSRAIKRTL